jgi:hypothetical protein
VAERKGDFVFGTQIGDPIPAEDAFDAHNDVLLEGRNQFEKKIRISFYVLMNPDFSFLVNNADIHFSGVQIDTTVVFMLFVVEFHNLASFG